MILVSAFIAGLLTAISPCIVFTLPFVVNSALKNSKLAPIYLMAGLLTAFIALGLVFYSVIQLFGISRADIHYISAVLLLLISVMLIFSSVYNLLAVKLSAIATAANNLLNSMKITGGMGEFITGLLLGAVWSPCAGPTLGFAISLISLTQEFAYAILIMLVFGIAASIPLLIIAYVSRNFIQQRSNAVNQLYSKAKLLMGVLIFTYSLLLLTSYYKLAESAMLDMLPSFIIEAIYKY